MVKFSLSLPSSEIQDRLAPPPYADGCYHRAQTPDVLASHYGAWTLTTFPRTPMSAPHHRHNTRCGQSDSLLASRARQSFGPPPQDKHWKSSVVGSPPRPCPSIFHNPYPYPHRPSSVTTIAIIEKVVADSAHATNQYIP